MRIMVIHPGHGFSTADVFTGVCAGLAACGAEVIPYPLDAALDVNLALYGVAQTHAPQIVPAFDPYAVAAHAIVGRAIWREVDCVLAVTGQNLHFGAVGTLRKAGILTALLCTESPYLTLDRERFDAQLYDVVFTNDRNAVNLFGTPAHYLPMAYNPAVHYQDGPRADDAPDVFFIGTGFDERRALFAAVDWTGIDFKLVGTLWDGEDDVATFLRRLMDNATAATYYRAAKINLNHHRTTMDYRSGQHIGVGAAYSLGPRAYEIAACGGFQLMDDSRPEAREVFGTSLATYRAGDSADLERQVRYWLAHPEERAQRAAEQATAVRAHAWDTRAASIIDILTGAAAHKEHFRWQPSTA
jgi:spore maturation protein CgeB